jgi:hypothetical protein
MNDVPMPRFVPPVFNDDEFATDDDIEGMRHNTIGCLLVERLASLG